MWQASYFWLLPQPHRFAASFASFDRMSAFDMDVSAPALAYLWEHQVCPAQASIIRKR